MCRNLFWLLPKRTCRLVCKTRTCEQKVSRMNVFNTSKHTNPPYTHDWEFYNLISAFAKKTKTTIPNRLVPLSLYSYISSRQMTFCFSTSSISDSFTIDSSGVADLVRCLEVIDRLITDSWCTDCTALYDRCQCLSRTIKYIYSTSNHS